MGSSSTVSRFQCVDKPTIVWEMADEGVPLMNQSPIESRENENGPKYLRIYAELLRWISTLQYRTGDKLPSESELVKEFGASRPTVARALAQLESEGLVERRAGSGTYVTRNAH